MIKKSSFVFSAVLLALASAQNCNLQIPDNPLTATGLSTPFLLKNITGDANSGTCSQANTPTGTFAQGAVINLDTGAVSIYNPLVINAGTTPAVAPTVPTLPTNNVVGIWFGFNGAQLNLVNAAGKAGGTQGNCVNGFNGVVFGEFSSCNAANWFAAANNAIAQGTLVVPALGNANDGKPCPTIRDYFMVDQDQSDNVVTQQLVVTKNGKVTYAQDTPPNRKSTGSTTIVANPSDNRLLCIFINPALGCSCWTAPDLADTGNTQKLSALPLNELTADKRQAAPQALVPINDPMVVQNGKTSVGKVNLYRAAVNQPAIARPAQAPAKLYCQTFIAAAFSRIMGAKTQFTNTASPDGAVSKTLFNFLVNTRFPVSFGAAADGGLDCVNMGLQNPFTAKKSKIEVLVGNTNQAPIIPQCINGQWTVHFVLQTHVRVDGGEPVAPMDELGLPKVTVEFKLDDEEPYLHPLGVFNVDDWHTHKNTWTFRLQHFQPTVGGGFTLITPKGCTGKERVPTLTTSFSSDTVVSGVGATVNGKVIPALVGHPTVINNLHAVNVDRKDIANSSKLSGSSAISAVVVGVAVIAVGVAAFVAIRVYRKKSSSIPSTEEPFIAL